MVRPQVTLRSYSGGMAFNIQFPLPAFDRARPLTPLPEVPNQPPPGSLVMIDNFEQSHQDAGHGNVGAFAARQHGFRGNIYAEKAGPDVLTQKPDTMATRESLNEPQTPEYTRRALQDFSRQNHRDLLQGLAGDMDKLQGLGLKDSAVNISMGTSPLRMANQILGEVREGTNPASDNFQFSQNVLKAYNIDVAKLSSPDPKVSGPERNRLQQSLLTATQAGADSPEVAQARSQYDQAVTKLQAQNNSVVVSAGNDQQITSDWTQEAQGIAPQVGPQANRNVLVNSAVTTVGATQWLRGSQGLSERVAPYSNQDPEVDILASGAVGNGFDVNQKNVAGTSYAAPRVAAALATLHGTHPGATAGQMRNLMQNRLTHSLSGGESVLNFGKAEEYMRLGRF